MLSTRIAAFKLESAKFIAQTLNRNRVTVKTQNPVKNGLVPEGRHVCARYGIKPPSLSDLHLGSDRLAASSVP